MLKKFSILALVVVLLTSMLTRPVKAATSPLMTGSFIQPSYLAIADVAGTRPNWTYNDWLEELTNMQNAGMDTLVIVDIANYDNKVTYYTNPNVPGYSKIGPLNYDMPLYILNAAQATGIKVYFGMTYSLQWFSHFVEDGGTWLNAKIWEDKLVATDIYNKYGSHTAFGGWYLNDETTNNRFTTTQKQDILATIFGAFCDHVKAMDPTKKIIHAPYVVPGDGLDATGWENMWKRVLNTANIDIMAMQDSGGWGNARRSEFFPYIIGQYNACVYRGRTAWVDIETFNAYGDWPNKSINDIVDAMTTFQNHAEKFITFAYNHYQSPKMTKSTAFQTTYNYYRTHGLTKDTTAPSTPSNFKITSLSPYEITLSWTSSTDNVALLGYNIYKDNAFYTRVWAPATSYTDIGLTPNTAHNYKIQAIDGAGNLSSFTSVINGTTMNDYPTVHSAGRTYTSNVAASPSYPDTNYELTNGVYGGTVFTNSAWQGRYAVANYEFVIDLGSVKDIKGITVNFMQDTGCMIYFPQKVEFFTSNSPTTGFTLVKEYEASNIAVAKAAPAITALELGVGNIKRTNRYVKVKVTASDYWTFIDEIKVKGGDVNLAVNKSYTSTMSANASYPDTGNAEITNNVNASTLFTDAAWQGRLSNNPFSYSFTVDLGANYSSSKFITTFLKDLGVGVYVPTSVSYFTSTDNVNFTSRGTVNAPAVADLSVGTYTLDLASGVSARYVKVTVNAPVGWSFIDEFKIIN